MPKPKGFLYLTCWDAWEGLQLLLNSGIAKTKPYQTGVDHQIAHVPRHSASFAFKPWPSRITESARRAGALGGAHQRRSQRRGRGGGRA